MNPTEINAQLTAPFPALEIEWRMGRTGIKKSDGTPWGKCFAYITNRAIMTRLDEVAGPAAWRNEYRFETIKSAAGETALCLCGLSLLLDGQWVTKWDGAEPTDIETGKGALSDSMKRAAVQWGIGRYLYRLEEGWAEFTPEGAHNAKIEGEFYRWNPPSLPFWALPERKASESRPEPAAPKVASRAAAASSPAQAPYPARQVTPSRIATAPAAAAQAADQSWRAFSVPRFIKKYAGKTLGDMEVDDILYWSNYEPRPFNGKIAPGDIELKRLLLIAREQLTGIKAPPPAAADAEYDVRYQPPPTMNHENIPTITIPLAGLSNGSLEQIIEVLNREGTTISLFPGAEMDAIARHYDRQLHLALLERFGRNLAADKIRHEQATLRLLGASVSHTNPIQIPA